MGGFFGELKAQQRRIYFKAVLGIGNGKLVGSISDILGERDTQRDQAIILKVRFLMAVRLLREI